MQKQFHNLVFEGGGIKAIAYGGALTRLEEIGALEHVQRVAGSSAGAISATLMAVGYSAKEILEIFQKTNFLDFADDDPGFFKDIYRLIVHYGWHKGNKFQDWISTLIEKKLGRADISFSELKALAARNQGLKELYIIGSNLSKQVSEIYSHETSPDMKINQAVRISMSIPFYFQVVINNYGDILVDGGVIRNYPINLFDNEKYLFDPQNGEADKFNKKPGYVFNHETLGFRLDDRDHPDPRVQNEKKITGIKSFALAIITFLQTAAAKTHIHEKDWNRTVCIDTTGVGVTEFNLSTEKVKLLTENGKQGVDCHFNWRQSCAIA